MSSSPHHHDDVDARVDLVFDRPRTPHRRRRWAIAATAVAIVTVGGLLASSVAGGASGPSYRTVRAERRDVAAELSSVATIEPVAQAAVAFPTSGTVSTVDVVVGDEVAVGQSLASLDAAQLTRSLNQRKEALAQAELTLSRALDGESVVDTPTLEPASTSSDASGSVVLAATSQASTRGTSSELQGLQQAVLDAQATVDDAIAASDAAMDAATAVCTAQPTTAPTTAVAPDAAAEVDPATDPDRCLEALVQVQDAQAATASAQQHLASASSALDAHLSARASQSGGAIDGSSQAPSGQAPTEGTAPSGQADTSSSPTSAQLVAYQKAVSAAELQVLVAEQAVEQATIVAPIGGTVVAVGFAAGDDVTAASSTQTVTIQGDDGIEVVTTVALSDVATVQVGQQATVLPDGSSQVLEGQVVAVAATPDDDASTASYRVTVGLTDPGADLGAGTTGTVAILTAAAREALAVPSSAVTWTLGTATVRVVSDGEADDVPVDVGVIGDDWIEVVSGVDAGDRVVLADLDEPLPGAASEVTDTQMSGVLPGGFGPPGG